MPPMSHQLGPGGAAVREECPLSFLEPPVQARHGDGEGPSHERCNMEPHGATAHSCAASDKNGS